MRLRLADGTHEVEIETSRTGSPPLHELEATAGRLLDRLRAGNGGTDDSSEQPFGFALDSSTERAEPYDDGRGAEYEDEDAQQ